MSHKKEQQAKKDLSWTISGVGCCTSLGFAPHCFPFVCLASTAIFASIDEGRDEFVLANWRRRFGPSLQLHSLNIIQNFAQFSFAHSLEFQSKKLALIYVIGHFRAPLQVDSGDSREGHYTRIQTGFT